MNIIVKVKKIGIILLATLIFFTGTFIFPLTEQKAHAFGLAVPAGIQIGAGVYVTGALITAGAAGLIGYDENSEAINAHAKGVWDGATQVSKDSINVMANAVVGAGNAMTDLDAPLGNWLESKIDEMGNFIAGLKHPEIMTDSSSFRVERGNKVVYLTLFKNFSATFDNSSWGSSWKFETYGSNIQVCASWCMPAVNVGSTEKALSIMEQLGRSTTPLAIFSLWNAYSPANQKFKFAINNPTFQATATTAVSQTREAWEGMRDAGLVLPVDSATAYVGNDVVKHNPANDTYTTDAGAVYSPSDVTWSFPTVIPRTDGVPVPGLYTDSPALTGNPAIDETIVNNPAIPKTTTNINTGVTTSNPDYVGEGNPPLEGGVPPTNPPPSKWEKPPTKKPPNIGALVTTKFPFSLPWDFFGVLGWINAEPKAPVFKLDTGLNTPFGKELKMDMEFKFNFLDPYMGYFRGFIIIGFSLFLILATRRLMGGAG